MRLFVIALTIASLTVPAFSQEDAAGSTKHHGASRKKVEEPKQKANDKDYKAALDRMPAQKYDPWGTVRTDDKK
jgi:hypothetical protein